MAHSVPDAVAIVLETPGRPRLPHRRLEARPHAGRRPAHRRRQARGARQPRRRPAARRLDERRAARRDRLRARRRRGLPPDHPARARAGSSIASFASNIHRMQQAIDVAVEVGRKVCVVGRSMRKNLNIARNLGYMDAPDDVLDPARTSSTSYRPDEAADPLHRLPGRAALGADADRLQRPPGRPGRARRHGDHLRASRARERAARPRRDQPARADRRRGAARGERAGARLRPRPRRRSCARCSGSSGRRR